MIMSTGEVPQEWKSSLTIPMYKKGEKKDLRNYRGISLLNTAIKLLTKIIIQHLSCTVSINEEQQGFRQNRSTIHSTIFILRQIIEKSIEFNKLAFLCFVHLTQAFDRVQLKDVLKILQERRVSNNIIQVIKQLNTNNSTRIQSGTPTTEEVQILTGIRQGHSLSPMLFNLVMDRSIKVKGVGWGYRMGQTEFKILWYADDAVLIAESEDNLQRMLFEFNQTANKYNIKQVMSF